MRFKTGNNKLKAGLDLQAGYGLGSFSIEGSLNAEVSLDADGLSFNATTFDPSINLELPYAYLNLDAVGQVKLNQRETGTTPGFLSVKRAICCRPEDQCER